MTQHLIAGGSGANGRVSAFGKDDKPLAELIAGDAEAVISAGQKGGRPGRLTLYDGHSHATFNVTSADGRVVAGGNGVNGRFSTHGTDGLPVVELIAGDKESVIGLGQVNRAARISLYDGAQPPHEAIRIDAASGDIVFENADCAEEFELDGEARPGDVVVIGPNERVRQCAAAYDRNVLGVISGAGTFRAAIVLGRRHGGRGAPVAILGKVWCRVDASLRPIRSGDLLTTAPTAGHAMVAADRRRCTGAVLGKALRGFPSGTGLIPILVTLR